MLDPDVVPPHDLDAERALLGAIMLDDAQLDAATAMLRADDFYRRPHAATYQQMVQLHARGEPLDYVTLSAALEASGDLEDVGPAYLAGLIDGVPRSSNVAAYARIVRDHATARKVLAYCRQAIDTFGADPSALTNGAGARFAEAIQSTIEAAHVTRPELVVLSEADLAQMTVPTGVIDALIPEGVTLLAAPPGVGKTTFAIAAAVAKAAKRTFLGRHVPSNGPVVFVLAEGAPFANQRIRAGKIAAGLDPNEPIGITTIPHAVNFFEAGADYREYCALLKGIKPAMQVIDTSGLCSLGADENSAADVTRTFAHIRATGVPAIVNHHLDKGGRAERGSSAFRANADALLTLLDTDDLLTLACEKMRDGAAFEPLRLKVYEVPEVGACSVRLADDLVATGTPSPAQRQALDALVAAFHVGSSGATRSEWHALLPTLKERTFYHAVGRLHTLGFVTEKSGRFTSTGRTA